MKLFRSAAVVFCTGLLLSACSKNGDPAVTESSSGSLTSSGVTKAESRESLIVRANNGEKDAQFDLGALYHDGEGVPKDLVLARQWFEKAAAQDEEHAQFNLGVMYYVGEGMKQDYAKALKLFREASSRNNARAQFNLGVMYYRGEGVSQDLLKAHELFTKAAMQNFSEAQFNLGVMEAKGEGIEADIGKAYAWFSAARENGNPRSDEVIKNIERELQPDQLKIVKKMAEDLRMKILESAKTGTGMKQ